VAVLSMLENFSVYIHMWMWDHFFVVVSTLYSTWSPSVLLLPWLADCGMWNYLQDTGVVHRITHSLHYFLMNLFIFIWGASDLVQLIKYNLVLTKGKPAVTSFPNM
jgi:hypothetical protein